MRQAMAPGGIRPDNVKVLFESRIVRYQEAPRTRLRRLKRASGSDMRQIH
jgi:hypothetical protein